MVEYGIGDEYVNADETCKFTLREVTVAKTIEYGERVYEAKDYALIIRADVSYTNYALESFGITVSDYRINYCDGKYLEERSVFDKQGDLLCDVSESLSNPYKFSAEKQNFSGTIFLCFKLKTEIYEYLRERVAEEISSDTGGFALDLNFNGKTFVNDATVRIGCPAKSISFADKSVKFAKAGIRSKNRS